MTWVAAATAAAAVVSAGSQIYASNKASDAMQSASGQSNAISQQIYNQQRADQMPYMQSGYGALNALNRLYGLAPVDTSVAATQGMGPMGLKLTPEKNGKNSVYVDSEGNGYTIAQYGENKGEVISIGRKFPQYAAPKATQPTGSTGNTATPTVDRYGGFYASPGYQFRLDEGGRAIDRSAAARGMLLSGAQNKALTRFGQGEASAEFGQYANALRNIAGLGTVANESVANSANAYGNNASAAAMNSGMARASGYLGTGNAIGSVANNVLASLPYYQGSLPGASATARDVNGNVVSRTRY